MKLVPTEDRVIVEPIKAQEKVGSIYIPPTAQDAPQKGKVIAIGKGRYEGGVFIAMDVQPDDMILFGKYSGAEIEVDGDKYLIMRQSDILAVFEED